MNQNEIKDLVTEYSALKEAENKDLSAVPTKYHAAQGMLKNQAKEKLPQLRAIYKMYLEEKAFTIFVRGPPEETQKFVTTCESLGLLCLDARGLYRKLGERALGSIGESKMFGSTQLALLIQDIREFVYDHSNEVRHVPEPHIADVYPQANPAQALEYVARLVRDASGDTLNQISMTQELVEKGLKIGYTQPVVPVLVYGQTQEEEAPLLFGSQSFVVPVTEKNSTEDGVLETLKKIREKLKKQ